MGFKITLVVLCLLVGFLCLVEGKNDKKHYKHNRHASKYKDTSKNDQQHEERRDKKYRLQTIKLSRKATHRQAGNDTEVEESGGFNFDFSKIPGGAGIKMIYDGLKNMFMAVNRVLNFGFIWDGISGIIAFFHLDTGATFVINAITKMGGFLGYMLTDVKNFVDAITSGGKMIVGSALTLMQSAFRFAFNTAGNLVINVLQLAYGILGVIKTNLQDILGPLYKVVYNAFKLLFEAAAKMAASVGNGIMIILEPILGAIRFVTSPIANVLSAVIRTAGGIFDNSVFHAIAEGLSGILQNVVGGVVGGIKGIGGGIFGALSGAINAVGTVFGNVRDAIKSALNFGKGDKEETTGYTNIKTTTIVDENPIHLTYTNNSNEFFQHFIREGSKKADVIILYKSDKNNFIAFYNRILRAVFILSGTTGNIGIFDIENGAGLFFKPNSTRGYAIQPPGFLRADFIDPNAKNVSDALTKLSHAIDELNSDLDETVDTVVIDILEVLRTLTLKNSLSSILTGETLVVVSRLLGNLLYNLADALPPILRPSLGVANTLLPFLLNLPQNLINGIISLIGSVVKRFLGIFVPEFLAELAKTVVIAVLKGLTTPMLASLLTPIGAISTTVNIALLGAKTALDLLNIP